MANVINEIKLELGGTSSLSDDQINLWIDDAQRLIGRRAAQLGVDVPAADRDYLTRLAVVAHARNPTGASQVDAAIDDGRISRRMNSSAGRVIIDEDLWGLIGLAEPDLSGGWSGSLPYVGSWR